MYQKSYDNTLSLLYDGDALVSIKSSAKTKNKKPLLLGIDLGFFVWRRQLRGMLTCER